MIQRGGIIYAMLFHSAVPSSLFVCPAAPDSEPSDDESEEDDASDSNNSTGTGSGKEPLFNLDIRLKVDQALLLYPMSCSVLVCGPPCMRRMGVRS